MTESRRRMHALVLAGISLALVVGVLSILLVTLTELGPVARVSIATASGLISAAVVYGLVARSVPPTPEVHTEQSRS